MDVAIIAVSIIGSVLKVFPVYYCGKTIRQVKGQCRRESWTYISLSAAIFGIGVVMFAVDNLSPMGLIAVGGFMRTTGAVLLVLGVRKNISSGAGKNHFS